MSELNPMQVEAHGAVAVYIGRLLPQIFSAPAAESTPITDEEWAQRAEAAAASGTQRRSALHHSPSPSIPLASCPTSIDVTVQMNKCHSVRRQSVSIFIRILFRH